jgi:hypothetical protein
MTVNTGCSRSFCQGIIDERQASRRLAVHNFSELPVTRTKNVRSGSACRTLRFRASSTVATATLRRPVLLLPRHRLAQGWARAAPKTKIRSRPCSRPRWVTIARTRRRATSTRSAKRSRFSTCPRCQVVYSTRLSHGGRLSGLPGLGSTTTTTPFFQSLLSQEEGRLLLRVRPSPTAPTRIVSHHQHLRVEEARRLAYTLSGAHLPVSGASVTEASLE